MVQARTSCCRLLQLSIHLAPSYAPPALRRDCHSRAHEPTTFRPSHFTTRLVARPGLLPEYFLGYVRGYLGLPPPLSSARRYPQPKPWPTHLGRSEEHTSELQSRPHL